MTEKSENINQKKNISVQKPFLSVGPSLRYSHNNVFFFWALALLLYIATLLFWSKLITGRLFIFPENWGDPEKIWNLSNLIRSPLNIFNYPQQILILGIIMGAIAIIPILISQLMSLRHSLAFIIAYSIIAIPVGFSFALLICSFAVASRPLRFRSRIISIALCMAPLIIYWGIYGSSKNLEPIRAALSYAPWLISWIVGIIIAAAVLGIGHFTRYRPGLVFLFTFITLLSSFLFFQSTVGLAELDYQLYVAGNAPDNVPEFYEQDISSQIDKMVAKIQTDESPFGFYPTDKEKLRIQLKKDIQNELRWDRWPRGFYTESKINFQKKRNQLLEQYNKFIHPEKKIWMPPFLHEWLISTQSRNKRLPIALYYKGIISELQPDILKIGFEEILSFNSNFAQRGNIQIWVDLYKNFPETPESIEARLRLAQILAREGNWEKAQELCDITLNMIDKIKIKKPDQPKENGEFLKLFNQPPTTVMDASKIDDLQFRTTKFNDLISAQNHNNEPKNKLTLKKFVSLNPNEIDYPQKLDALLNEVNKNSPLLDNILLAKALLINDDTEKLNQLKQISEKYPNTDGAICALYQMGILRVQLWQKLPDDNRDIKNNYLHKARELLEALIATHPEHFLSTEAKKILNSLPQIN